MAKRILVTSALPYANGPLHIGHLVEYIQTDIFVRFLKLIGEDVIYCCADDAHGTPIEINAAKQGITPKELIERYFKEHQNDFKDFFVEFDNYYTTDSKENKEYADLIFSRLNKAGHIIKKKIFQPFCPNCRRFLPDRYVKGDCPKCGAKEQYGDVCESCGTTHKAVDLINPQCAICDSKPEKKETEHYFFKLSNFSQKLKNWLDKNKKLQPEMKNYVKNWIKDGLEDWCISRDGHYFGFKIPGEENKYYYVWLDAPIGYIASTANYCRKRGSSEKEYWEGNKEQIIHFIGKDIIYFHFLFWPAMLMGSNLSVPDYIVVHGFLTVNGEKMSKSRGTFFTAREFLEKFNPSYLRFYYAQHLSRKMADVDLSFRDFQETINNKLVSNLANFCYRVLSFTNKFADSRISGIKTNKKIVQGIKTKTDKIKQAYENLDYKTVVKEILAVSDIGNRHFQENEPWKIKDKEKIDEVLGVCVNIAKEIIILIKPILPVFAKELEKQLRTGDLKWNDLGKPLTKHTIGKAEIIFHKIEEISELKEDFKLDLRIGEIKEAKQHPDADKLLVLQVNLGKEKRQLVAGIKEFYKPEELIGRKIVVVVNLKSAKLRGIESNGMLLAASGRKVVLLEPKGKPGDSILINGAEPHKRRIDYNDFKKLKLVVKDKKILYNGKVLKNVSVNAEDGCGVS